MKHYLDTLPNGLRIVTVPMPDAHSVSIAVTVGVGSRHETFASNGGVSHFLEHLLFKGTTQRPSTKIISEAIDGVGGVQNAYTSNDMTVYYVKLPKQNFELGIDILSDMIQNSLLEPEEVDRERGVVIEEMNVVHDDPARHVFDLLPPLLWANDPLGREVIGNPDVIRSIPRDDIAAYQKLHYSPDNMVVSVAGNVTRATVKKLVSRFMGSMQPTKLPKLAKLNSGLSTEFSAELPSETNQAHIVIGSVGYEYGHPDGMAARVLSSLLGGGMSSRLFIEVRERQGLAYTVYSSFHSFIDTGLFDIYAGVSIEKATDALGSIMAELAKVRDELVSAEELELVKNKLGGGLQLSLESTSTLADRYGSRLLLTGSVKTVEETLAEIAAVTVEDLQRVAIDLLAPSKLRMAVIAPDPKPIRQAFDSLTKE